VDTVKSGSVITCFIHIIRHSGGTDQHLKSTNPGQNIAGSVGVIGPNRTLARMSNAAARLYRSGQSSAGAVLDTHHSIQIAARRDMQ
jgi:hypothetical protein